MSYFDNFITELLQTIDKECQPFTTYEECRMPTFVEVLLDIDKRYCSSDSCFYPLDELFRCGIIDKTCNPGDILILKGITKKLTFPRLLGDGTICAVEDVYVSERDYTFLNIVVEVLKKGKV